MCEGRREISNRTAKVEVCDGGTKKRLQGVSIPTVKGEMGKGGWERIEGLVKVPTKSEMGEAGRV